MLRGEAEDGGRRWPERLRPALRTRGFAVELRDFLLRAAERGLDGRGLARLGAQRGRDDWEAGGRFPRPATTARFDLAPVPAYDYAEIIRIAAALLDRRRGQGTASARPTTWSWWTSTRTPTRPRRSCCTPWPGTAGS